MIPPRHAICGFMALLTLTQPATAQIASDGSLSAYEGLYRPAGELGASWSCNPDFIGMDGGAMAVLDGYLEGVENRCKLTDRQAADEGSTRFIATCSAEGETFSEPVVLRRTQSGLSVTRNGTTVEWASCGLQGPDSAAASVTATNGAWIEGYAQGVTEIWAEDPLGNRITFTCSGGYDGGLYVELDGRPAPRGNITIDIDGHAHAMSVWAEGGAVNTESRAGADNFEAIWSAAAQGNLMSVIDGAGEATSFSLEGITELLGPEPCLGVGNSW